MKPDEVPTGSNDAVSALELLRGIWQELLETPVRNQDDFFDLGGDSLLAVIAATEAAGQGLHLTTQDIFDYPHLNDLAEHAVCIRNEEG